MDEFSLIETYFRPLAKNTASLNLTDDCALVSLAEGYELAVTTDAICEGVHFIGDEDPALIARKALRVNLSDLAAMGAKPLHYFLALMLPKHTQETWLAAFTAGLAQDQQEFSITLAGGDTTATHGPLACSITALGLVPQGKALKRSGAKAGDDIYVSGTLGDSALGLLALEEKASGQEFLIERYLLPQPRLELGRQLIGIASAAMDISDGLMQDLGHICKASGVGAQLEAMHLPLSASARTHPLAWNLALCGGDDYELLFTAPGSKQAAIRALAKQLALPLTRIGQVTSSMDIVALDEHRLPVALPRAGFKHFA